MDLTQIISDGSEYPKIPLFGYLVVFVLVGYINRSRKRKNPVSRYLVIGLSAVLILAVLFSTQLYVDIIDLPRALEPWISIAFFMAGVGLVINMLIPNSVAKSTYAEMLGAEYGIGAYILQAGSLYDLERLFVGVAILSILGVLVSGLIGLLERTLLKWRV